MPTKPRPTPSSYSYDKERGTYRRKSTGRFVSRREIRQVIDRAIVREQRELTRLARQLQSDTITLARWQEQSATVMKNLHLWNGAAARGGWGQMTQRDYGRVGARLFSQYSYLDNFAQELERGEAKLQSGQFLTRVGMYADAGRNTYEAVLQNEMGDVGMTEERNVLAPADHCDGCLDADAQGWVPLGTLPLPGERDCLTRCKCEIIYR